MAVAVAAIEERQLLKSLRWWDGFAVALANPGFLIGSLGFSIGALGAWGAFFLWTVSMALGTVQNWIYAETATMFPDKPGGIALYAHEGWRRYFSLVGPVATFGYWFAWSTVLSIFGILIGTLIQAQWFPNATWTLWDGAVHLGLPHFIAVGLIIAVWLFNVFGIRPAVWLAYVTGALLMVPLAVFVVLPFLSGNWQAAKLTWTVGSGWSGVTVALVWLYVMGWSAYGVETCATFAPEYKNTQFDVPRALKSSALFSLAVYALLPLGIGGVTGVLQVDRAEPAEREAMPAVAGRHHAVEHVDAARHRLHQVVGRADAHEVARLVRRQVRLHRLDHGEHHRLGLAHREAADGVALEVEGDEGLLARHAVGLDLITDADAVLGLRP